MVDNVKNSGPVPQQTPVDLAQTLKEVAKEVQSAGIAATKGVTLEQSPEPLETGKPALHDCERPVTGAIATMRTVMHDLADKAWDPTADIFALLRRATAEMAADMSDLEVESTMESNAAFKKLIEKKIERADRKLGRSNFEAWMMGVEGGVQGLGAIGQNKTAGDVGKNAAATSTVGVGKSVTEGFKTGIAGRLEKEIDLVDKDVSVTEHAQQGSDKLRGKFGSTFSDLIKANQQIVQDQATSVAASISGLRDRA